MAEPGAGCRLLDGESQSTATVTDSSSDSLSSSRLKPEVVEKQEFEEVALKLAPKRSSLHHLWLLALLAAGLVSLIFILSWRIALIREPARPPNFNQLPPQPTFLPSLAGPSNTSNRTIADGSKTKIVIRSTAIPKTKTVKTIQHLQTTNPVVPEIRPEKSKSAASVATVYHPVFPSPVYGQADHFKVCKNLHFPENSAHRKSSQQVKYNIFRHLRSRRQHTKPVKVFNRFASSYLAMASKQPSMVSAAQLKFDARAKRSTNLRLISVKFNHLNYSLIRLGGRFLCMQRNGKVKALPGKKFKIPNCFWALHMSPSTNLYQLFSPNCCTDRASSKSSRSSDESSIPRFRPREVQEIKKNPDTKPRLRTIEKYYNLCTLNVIKRKGRFKVGNGRRAHYTSNGTSWLIGPP